MSIVTRRRTDDGRRSTGLLRTQPYFNKPVSPNFVIVFFCVSKDNLLDFYVICYFLTLAQQLIFDKRKVLKSVNQSVVKYRSG